MKKNLFAIILALTLAILCGCTPAEVPEETTVVPETLPPETTPIETEPVETEPQIEVLDPLTLSYDDYLTEIHGILPNAEGVTLEGSAIEVTEVKGVTYFHAKDLGTAKITTATQTVEITVQKAKLNLIVIMGQSNSGNHFANATSDITCPLGTAYWWGAGRGIACKTPTNFTQATMGFHSTLLAELYAQSVAAGDPVKNVLVWHEGGNQQGEGTSKNGSSIYGWAASPSDTSGTDYTVKMVNKCVEYYAGLGDKVEIVSRGVYWLQGEGDGVRGIDPVEYSACLSAIWNKLKTEAGLEYMAIMRVRQGGDKNTLNGDIFYSTTVSAQYDLANKNPDIFMATTLTEYFTGAPTAKKTVDFKNYIRMMAEYSSVDSYKDKHGNTATVSGSKLTTPMSTLFGSNNNNHYGKFGYTLIASDAAYNMYNALHGSSFGFLMANSSGRPEDRVISKAGDTVEVDITDMVDDLAFRVTEGSTAGTVAIKITSAGKDVTSELINASGANFGCANVKAMKGYNDVVITVTFTAKSGEKGSVTYKIIDNSIDLPADLPAQYSWEFDGDLLARDKDGRVVNAMLEKALLGSYKIEGGILSCTKAQLEIVKAIDLRHDKNWSIEIGFGDITGANGFILASEATNIKGNKALSYRGGKLTVSDYDVKEFKSSAGYYNYSDEGSRLSTGTVIKLVNTYDAATGKSVVSVYRDGVLTIEDLTKVTGDFNGSTTLDMSPYPFVADFAFSYLGNSNSSGSFLLTNNIDFIRVDTGK